jgi:hypothetical protein
LRSCLTDESPAVVDEAAAHIEALLAAGALRRGGPQRCEHVR